MLLGTYSNVFRTPLGAFTTLFPLAVVLTISMIQEGLADIKRHRADEEVSFIHGTNTDVTQTERIVSVLLATCVYLVLAACR
jgi:hypothetical protein